MLGSISRLLRRAVDIKENEVAALVWSCVYFFLILTSYYILRPIRDEVGAVLGVKPSGADDLAWMFTGTLVGVLLVHPLFASMVAKMPRKRFVPLIYRFFISHLVIFYLLYKFIDPKQGVWIGYVFFVWVSIFNLFVVSVFWSFMTDIYQPGQSKRLFGVVAVGGTIGALTGSSITSLLVEPLGGLNLFLVSALFLELACQASRRLAQHEPKLATVEDSNETEVAAATTAAKLRNEEVIGGGMMEGVKRVMASPYLLGITGIMLFFTVSSTFLYFQKAVIVKEYFGDDSAARTAFFANVDLATNVLTLITQLFITGRMMRLLGVGVALGFLPIVSLIGFGVLAVSPVLGVLVALEALRRAGNYAVQRPARETLYLVLPRTDKYKSKNFNDTFVYRAGDQLGAWSYAILGKMGIGISGLAFSMIPFSIAWLVLALWLGRKNHRLQQEHNA